MKIVHELYGYPQVGGGGLRPYAGRPDDPTKPVDGYVDEILIVSIKAPFREDEVLRIEGSLSAVHLALEMALRVVETMAGIEVERGNLDPEWKTKGRESLEFISTVKDRL